tara:strand:- start:834 stop:1463 length:630 start_codon:yes stop_codon:yes gene_type:complete
MKIALYIISICCIIIILDVYSHKYNTPNSNLHKEKYIDVSRFQTLLNSKYPIAVRTIHDQLPKFFSDSNVLPKPSYIKSLLSPLNISSHIEYIQPDNLIRTTYNNKTFIIQTSGESLIWLFHPSQTSLLYTDTKENGHKISNIQIKHPKMNEMYPLFKHSSYSEIKLKQYMFLSIPNNWSYCIYSHEGNSSPILITSNTIGSILHFLLQ